MRRVRPGVMALLLAVAAEAAAQAYRPASLERFEQAPPHVLAHSPSAIRASGHDMDLQALDAFAERRAERLGPLERSEGWRLYGRLGLLNFQDEPDQNGSGIRVNLRRTGPAPGTKIYIGIHRRF
jgi:hypothetical protein